MKEEKEIGWVECGEAASKLESARARFYRETIDVIVNRIRSDLDPSSMTSLRTPVEMELGIFLGCLKKKHREEFMVAVNAVLFPEEAGLE